MTTPHENSGTNVSLPAIESKHLHGFLEKYGLLAPLMQGSLHCTSCSVVLNDANIGALLVRSGSLIAYCNSATCIEVAMGERGK